AAHVRSRRAECVRVGARPGNSRRRAHGAHTRFPLRGCAARGGKPLEGGRSRQRRVDEAVLRRNARSRREAGGRTAKRSGRHVENQGMGCALLLGSLHTAGGMAVMTCSLTQESFDGLLASLGNDHETAGRKYLEIRRNLVRLFEWRGCATPDEYADE